MGQKKKERETERLGLRMESMRKKKRWVGQSTQAERDMCKKTFLRFPKQKMKMKNQDMVRINGGTPWRQQQYGLDTATKGLTDPLLPCYWFCCSYFHKLGTKASSCQSSDILCQLSL